VQGIIPERIFLNHPQKLFQLVACAAPLEEPNPRRLAISTLLICDQRQPRCRFQNAAYTAQIFSFFQVKLAQPRSTFSNEWKFLSPCALVEPCLSLVNIMWRLRENFADALFKNFSPTMSNIPAARIFRDLLQNSTAHNRRKNAAGLPAPHFSTNPQRSSQQQESLFLFFKITWLKLVVVVRVF
jgi:hypothetical protein